MNAQTPIKQLPHSIEAEQAFLGALLVNNAVFEQVEHFLSSNDFFEPIHRRIFEVASDLIKGAKQANPITVKPFLPEQKLGELSIMQYLARLAAEAVTISHASDYAQSVYEMARRRDLIGHAQNITDQAFNADADVTPWELAGAAEADLRTITGEWRQSGAASGTLGDAVEEAYKAIGEAYQFKRAAGLLTGLDDVDHLTGPWEPGQQIIIGGGTKQGKTALAMQCALGLARHGPVWVYSGEMSRKQVAMREIARRTGIPVSRQKEGRISKSEFEKIEQARVEVNKLPVFIEKRRLTLEQIHQTLRQIKREHGLVSCVIDHIGLLRWNRHQANLKEHEQAAIATQELKMIYEDVGIPGISLVQLKKNTFVVNQTGRYSEQLRMARTRRPKYTDLMGSVEQDADHVIIPFNARPILSSLEPTEGTEEYVMWEGAMQMVEGKAEIILALSREQYFPQRREVEWHGQTTSFGPSFVGRQETMESML